MELIALPAFTDNYIWLWRQGQEAVAVDPGDATPVLTALARENLRLKAILVTHHHADHTGGVTELHHATQARVYGPAAECVPEPYTPVTDKDGFELLGQPVRVLDVPGHTAGHVAYFLPQAPRRPVLFCGDTLFSGGCGRIFEGTPAQMLCSLNYLASLPEDTDIYCAHEYTLTNLRFARAVMPDNRALQDYQAECQALRDLGLPTLPARLGREREINPFLRIDDPALRSAVTQHAGLSASSSDDSLQIFTALRQWKNDYR